MVQSYLYRWKRIFCVKFVSCLMSSIFHLSYLYIQQDFSNHYNVFAICKTSFLHYHIYTRESYAVFKKIREWFISDVLTGVLFFGYIFNVLNIATLLVLLIICILKFKDDIDVHLRKWIVFCWVYNRWKKRTIVGGRKGFEFTFFLNTYFG